VKVSNVGKRHAENRAFERHSVLLPASISIPGSAVVPAEIRDFCAGGLFVSYEGRHGAQGRPLRIPPGQLIEIRCTAPLRGQERALLFRGRVVHGNFGGIGVCFVDPAPDALAALQDFAAETCLDGFATRSGPDAGARLTKQAGTTAAPVDLLRSPLGRNGFDGALAHAPELVQSTLSVLRAKGQDVAREIAEIFLEHIGQHLLRAADGERAFHQRRFYYDTADLFTREGAAFKRALEEAARTRLNQLPALPARRTDKDHAEWSAASLSLVDPLEFEDWLAFSGIARFAEMQYQEQLDALVPRLEALFNVPIDSHNNPFGPASFCQAFQQAVKTLELERVV